MSQPQLGLRSDVLDLHMCDCFAQVMKYSIGVKVITMIKTFI